MAKIGAIFHGRIHLYDSDGAIVNDPTITAGDVVVCKADGTVANIATEPTANATDKDLVEYELGAAETAGDPGETVTIKWQDQVGDEWEPLCIDIALDTYRLADLPQAIWDALTSALTTVGSIGKLLVDNIDAAISSRSTFDPSADEVDVGEIKGTAVTGPNDLKADISTLNDLSAAEVNAEVDTALGDYDGPTKTEMDAAFTEIKGSSWSTETLKAIKAAIDAVDTGALTSGDLDTFVNQMTSLLTGDNQSRTLNTSKDSVVADIELGTISGSIKNFYPNTSKTIELTIKENTTNVTFGESDAVTLMLKSDRTDADSAAELTVAGSLGSGKATFTITPSDTVDIAAGDYYLIAKYVSGSDTWIVYENPVKVLAKVTS